MPVRRIDRNDQQHLAELFLESFVRSLRSPRSGLGEVLNSLLLVEHQTTITLFPARRNTFLRSGVSKFMELPTFSQPTRRV